jgi:hypothetical protein
MSKEATYGALCRKTSPSLAPPRHRRQLPHTAVSARLEPLAFPYQHEPSPKNLTQKPTSPTLNIDGHRPLSTPQRPLSLCSGNRSSCPIARVHCSPSRRSRWAESVGFIAGTRGTARVHGGKGTRLTVLSNHRRRHEGARLDEEFERIGPPPAARWIVGPRVLHPVRISPDSGTKESDDCGSEDAGYSRLRNSAGLEGVAPLRYYMAHSI